jgi:uncharacterized membrane protein YgcG
MLGSDHSAFSRGLPLTRLAWLARGLLTAALALGCTPQIGDKCTVSTNCSTTGDRLCDVTQPDGYCTKFNCEPGSCPEDSVCVNFGTTLSNVEQYAASCAPTQGNSPYKRSFCMANCSANNDCRSGYECLAAEQLNAVLAEHNSSQRVCGVRPKDSPENTLDAVCIGSDAGPSEGGSSSTGGSGGSSGGATGGTSSGGGASSAGDGGATDGGAAGDGGAGG